MSTAAERRALVKKELLTLGYTASVSTALAAVKDDKLREKIARGLPSTGIADGPPRAYLIALVVWGVAGGNYPSCPAKIRAIDAPIIQARAKTLADAIRPPAQTGKR